MVSEDHEAFISTGELFRRIEEWAAVVDARENNSHARKCGADNFTPAMLPNLWRDPVCPYSTPAYKTLFMEGFYSCAAFFLIDRLIRITVENPMAIYDELARELGLDDMLSWYNTPKTHQEYRRVPAGVAFSDAKHDYEVDLAQHESGLSA
jgi:hypothetical protein